MKDSLVFLGGTCNGSTWRDELIPKLNIKFFNPIVKEWTEQCRLAEIEQRNAADYLLYVITPKMTGVYSIAEVVDDSWRAPYKTLLCVLKADGEDTFSQHQEKSLNAVSELVSKKGVRLFNNLQSVAEFLNKE